MTTQNAGEKEQGMSEGPYKVGYQRGYHTVIDGSGVIVYSDDTSGGVNMFADAANYAHSHATDAAARRVRELEEERDVYKNECAKARAILGPFGTLRDGIIQEDGLMYEDARRASDAIAGKERSDGAE
jgi:hypothetical protein